MARGAMKAGMRRLGVIACATLLAGQCMIMKCASDRVCAGSPVAQVFESMNGEPVVPREANKIFIPPFTCATGREPLCQKLAIRVRELIAADGRLAVVDAEADADIVLAGAMTHYQIQPLEYDEMERIVKKRMRMTAAARLTDLRRSKEIFFEREIQSFDTYSEIVPPVMTEPLMQDRVMESLARRIVLTTVTGWYTGLMTPVEKGKR